jgi:hypothetical protein
MGMRPKENEGKQFIFRNVTESGNIGRLNLNVAKKLPRQTRREHRKKPWSGTFFGLAAVAILFEGTPSKDVDPSQESFLFG